MGFAGLPLLQHITWHPGSPMQESWVTMPSAAFWKSQASLNTVFDKSTQLRSIKNTLSMTNNVSLLVKIKWWFLWICSKWQARKSDIRVNSKPGAPAKFIYIKGSCVREEKLRHREEGTGQDHIQMLIEELWLNLLMPQSQSWSSLVESR